MRLLILICFIAGTASLLSQKSLFNLVDSDKSGLDFNNIIKDSKEQNILLYANFYGGGGVGLADFNNDGLTDIYLTGNLVGDEIYKNKGNLVFEKMTPMSGIIDDGNWSSGVAIADVNGDGLLDIYVSKELYDFEPERRKNKLYLNQGDFKFIEAAEKWGIADDQRSRQSVFFDYNRDGFVDLFVMNHPPNRGSYSPFSGQDLIQPKYSSRLYRNINNEFFEDVTVEANLLRTGYPSSAIASDLNNDGWPDLYVTNDFDVPEFLYINNGNGTFSYQTEKALRHTSFYSMGIDAADINNDGYTDFMTLDMVAEDNFRIKSNMSGMNPQDFWNVVSKGGHYQYMFNALQLNNGNGSFSEIAHFSNMSSTDWSWSNLIADFNNDGLRDVHITNGLLRDIRNTDADKEVDQFVKNYIKEYIKNNPSQGDIDIWDILPLNEVLSILPSVKLPNYMFNNKGGFDFENTTSLWGLDKPSFSNGSAYADLDNDGDLEIVINNVNSKPFLYKNLSVENTNNNYVRFKLINKKNRNSFGAKCVLYTPGNVQYSETSSIRGMYSSSESEIHFGIGKEKKIDSIEIYWPDQKKQVLYSLKENKLHTIKYEPNRDIHKNHIDKTIFKDISINDNAPKYSHKENFYDDYNKQILLPHKFSQTGPALTKGDVNGDGLEDFFIGGASSKAGALFIQTSENTFKESISAPWKKHKYSEDIDATFIDSDSDGDLDLYVMSGGNEFEPQNQIYFDRLYINDGFGNFIFKKELLPEIFESGSVVISSDYDEDGDIDLFIGTKLKPWHYPEPSSSYLLENKNGIFTIDSINSSLFKNWGMINDAVWSDIDNDLDEDLIILGEWTSPTVYINENGVFYKKETPELDKYKGWWFSINEADIDNDGDMDLIAGNLGENFKYKASKEFPFEVHYGDFDSNGNNDVVLSYYNYGKQYPLRGFSCSSQQIPELQDKFEKYDMFASLDLKSVFGEKLNDVLNLKATDFSSLIFINNGSGFYTAKELPYRAQLSSVNDVLTSDFNNDGIIDILLIGNMYQVEIETPRNDAGIGALLLGTKNGEFEFTPLTKSGFFTPGDAKKMIEIKTHDGKFILVANNNDVLQTFNLN
ncbi:VCBS repeat-containing protein [Flavobacteriaceae bacterium]|jgi:hypothetical protein|nr:VCBS repeat-containing protein [Flavobacteriaceae bacterium]MDA9019420.1 VCBS repeat-containing protein [bacterium]MDA8849013.1 VCBS repeat-containing protein [Flavobacteriaceae bacterium]MDB4063978.1 VCBS repeat-containing protein [Flavobacteriaceae bacterium]MDB4256046.1 VCBS repeat-containing protein [Flavobacteriaceae bacterium]